MSKKYLYVGADGLYTESLAYEATDFIATSAGAGDAGKPIVLDAAGHIDASMINDADIDHGSIGGLADDDHTQYILVAGTRAFTGNQSFGGFNATNLAAAVADGDGVNYGQVKALLNGLSNKRPARAATTANITLANVQTVDGVSLVANDRVLVKNQSTAADNGIYVVVAGGAWTRALDFDENSEVIGGVVISVSEGTVNGNTRWMLTSDDPLVVGTDAQVWDKWYISDLEGGDGVSITGDVIAVDFAANAGLKFSGGQLAVEPAHIVGEGLIDDGSDNIAIDWSTAYNDSKAVKASDLSSTASGKGASILGVQDSAGYFTATHVEGVLAEIGLAIATDGSSYTVGAGGVTKGDPLYISANDTVLPYSTITTGRRIVGLAANTASAAASVKAVENGKVLTGVLSGATAGTAYYWNGTAYTSTIPNTAGNYVYQVGVAKNATDLTVQVSFVHKAA